QRKPPVYLAGEGGQVVEVLLREPPKRLSFFTDFQHPGDGAVLAEPLPDHKPEAVQFRGEDTGLAVADRFCRPVRPRTERGRFGGAAGARPEDSWGGLCPLASLCHEKLLSGPDAAGPLRKAS